MKIRISSHKNKIILTRICVIIAFICVILKPSIAFNGTISGLKLWANTVLPGLFAALIITSFILAVFPMKKSISYIYIIITGVFCGFPIGAMLCGQFHQQNPKEFITEKIIAFCNISSPSFVINYIIFSILNNLYPVHKVLLCIYMPVVESLLFILLKNKNFFRKTHTNSKSNEENNSSKLKESVHLTSILDKSINNAVTNMLKLGGYIILFSCIAAYIYELPFISSLSKSIICGVTEITNGIYLCAQLPLTFNVKLVLITAINAFGGISTLMQTVSIINGCGISIKKYVYNKLLFTILTIINSLFIVYIF